VTNSIGVAYFQDGKLKIAQDPTRDRERVIQALSAPTGSKPANPFGALTDLMNGWDWGSARRAVLLISNGFEPAGTETHENSFAEAVIETAQRAGVLVYAVYHPSADYATSDYSKLYSGQVELAHVAYETGGEAFFLGFGPLPSLAPFLADIAEHLANQYMVEFLANPGEKPGLCVITVKCNDRNIELMAPGRVWIPGPGGTDEKAKAAPGKQ